MTTPRNVAIFVFDEVEVLDMCGPFEVFSVTGRDRDPKPFRAYLVAEEKRPVVGRHGFSVNPHYDFTDCPKPDILLIPGGYGTRREMHNAAVIEWVKSRSAVSELTLSVCTGALVLAKAGLLDGLEVTTHHLAMDLLRLSAPKAVVRSDRRFFDNGKLIASGGIAAGIDMSLHVVAKLLGVAAARDAAEYMEYPWHPLES